MCQAVYCSERQWRFDSYLLISNKLDRRTHISAYLHHLLQYRLLWFTLDSTTSQLERPEKDVLRETQTSSEKNGDLRSLTSSFPGVIDIKCCICRDFKYATHRKLVYTFRIIRKIVSSHKNSKHKYGKHSVTRFVL